MTFHGNVGSDWGDVRITSNKTTVQTLEEDKPRHVLGHFINLVASVVLGVILVKC